MFGQHIRGQGLRGFLREYMGGQARHLEPSKLHGLDEAAEIMLDSGPNARSVQIKLPQYTLVGATTRAGMLTSPLRDRFGIKSRLDYYDAEILERIVKRSAAILGIAIEENAALEIAKRSRGTPRIANRLLRRTRDFADYEDKKTIFKLIAINCHVGCMTYGHY